MRPTTVATSRPRPLSMSRCARGARQLTWWCTVWRTGRASGLGHGAWGGACGVDDGCTSQAVARACGVWRRWMPRILGVWLCRRGAAHYCTPLRRRRDAAPPGVFMSDMCIFTASQVRTDTLVTNTYIYHVEQRPLKYSMHSRASWRPRLAPPMAPP